MRAYIVTLMFMGTLVLQAEESFRPYHISYQRGWLRAPSSYQNRIRFNIKKASNCREVYLSGKDNSFKASSKSGKTILNGKSIGALFNRLAKENDGKAVEFVFKAGVYVLDQPLKPGENHMVRGEKGVTLKPALDLSAAVVIDGKESVFLSDFTIEGGGIGKCETTGILAVKDSSRISISKVTIGNVGGCGILCKGSKSQYVLIEKCGIRNTGRSGIAMFDGISHALITANIVERTTTHGIIFANGGSFCEVTDNIIKDTGIHLGGDFAHGIAFDSHGHLHKGEKNIIANNRILNSRTGGIEIADGQDHMYIIKNHIEGSGREDQKREDQYGIYFGGALSQGYHCLIQGNTIKSSCWDGIRVAAPNVDRPNKKSPMSKEKYGPTTHVNIVDNIISGSIRYGIELNWCKDVTIIGNQISESNVADIGIMGGETGSIAMPAMQVRLRSNKLRSALGVVTGLIEDVDGNE